MFSNSGATATLSGILQAMVGVHVSIRFVHPVDPVMTRMRAVAALAAPIFGTWRAVGAFGATLLLRPSSALARRLATSPPPADGQPLQTH